ncbi:MAG: hypothetical protein LBC49_00795 [Bacteroidales bacterium]|nr:hypothetical protein [Bacteroidales bacterium]
MSNNSYKTEENDLSTVVCEPSIAYKMAVHNYSTMPCRMTESELNAEIRQSIKDADNGLGITISEARSRHPRL